MRFRIVHPFALDEPEPKRRFASALCAAHSAVTDARGTFTDERTGQMYTRFDVLRLCDVLWERAH